MTNIRGHLEHLNLNENKAIVPLLRNQLSGIHRFHTLVESKNMHLCATVKKLFHQLYFTVLSIKTIKHAASEWQIQ